MTKSSIRDAVNAELARRDMSVYRLAHDTGISQQNLQHWLSGNGGLRLDRAEAVMHSLGLKVVSSERSETHGAESTTP